MTWMEIGKLAIQIIVAAGGLAGIGALLLVSAQKRKLFSESGKTDAEADLVMTDAYARRATAETSLLDPYERIQARMQREIDALTFELERVRAYVETLVEIVREQGVPVPAMPPKRPTAPEPPAPVPVAGRRRRRR